MAGPNPLSSIDPSLDPNDPWSQLAALVKGQAPLGAQDPNAPGYSSPDMSPAALPGASNLGNLPPLPNNSQAPASATQSVTSSAPSMMGAQAMGDGGFQKAVQNVNNSGIDGLNLLKNGLQGTQDRMDYWKNAQLSPDLSGLYALADNFNGTHLLNDYKRPMNEQDRQMLLDKLNNTLQDQKHGLTDEQVKVLDTMLKGQYMIDSRADAKKAMDSSHQTAADEKAKQAYINYLDTEKNAGRMAPIAQSQKNVYNADRLQTAIDQMPDKNNIAPNQVGEITAAVDSLLSNGNTSVQGRESIVPKSLWGDSAKIAQYIAGIPVGARQKEFIDRLQDLASRERQTNQNQLTNWKNKIIAANGLTGWAKRNKTDFDAINRIYLDPQYQNSVPGSGNNPTNVNARNSAVNGAPNVGDIIDGHRFKGGDPSQKSNWEPVGGNE